MAPAGSSRGFCEADGDPAEASKMPPVACSGPFEVLHCALVLFGSGAGFECSQIPPLAGLRVLLARIEPVRAVLEFADHAVTSGRLVGNGSRSVRFTPPRSCGDGTGS